MIKRTPPHTPNTGSLPNIASLTEVHGGQSPSAESSNITTRVLKRPRDDCSEIKELLTDMFATWKLDQDAKHNAMLDTLSEIKDQNMDIRSSMDFMSSKFDEMSQRITFLEEERKNNRHYIQSLETKVDTLERSLKMASIELRNIPQPDKETKSQLVDLIKNAGNALDITIQTSDIRDVYRTGAKPGVHKPVVVDLNSVIIKNQLIQAVKTFNKKKPKFSTENLGIMGPPSPVYVSEYLPPKAKKLYHLARVFATTNDFTYCWTSYGKVYLRQRDGGQLYRIETEEDLKKINLEQNSL